MLKAGRGWVTVVSCEPCISMQCVVKCTNSGLARPMEGSADNSTMAQQSMQIGTIGTPGHTDSHLVDGSITCVLRVYRSRIHTNRRVPQTFRCLRDGDVTMPTLHASLSFDCLLLVQDNTADSHWSAFRTVAHRKSPRHTENQSDGLL